MAQIELPRDISGLGFTVSDVAFRAQGYAGLFIGLSRDVECLGSPLRFGVPLCSGGGFHGIRIPG